MSAPRLVWMPPDFDVAYVSKSDYDELQAKLTETEKVLEMTTKGVELQNQTLSFLSKKLTEAERLNALALEAMKEAQRVSHKVVGLKLKVLNNAIKELEALK